MTTASAAEQRFFLTRHSANIMEDLSRQLHQPNTVNIIYGADGVGKSRLLQEFISTRVDVHTISRFQFIEGGECQQIDNSGQHSAQPFLFSTDTLRQIAKNSLVLLDQFEYATAESKRLILEFWNKYANKTNCKLIVCGHQRVISELKDLSLPEGIEINSVELSPLSLDESQQYMSSRLCTGSGQSVHMTRKLSTQLKGTEGKIANLNHLIQQHAGLVECKAADNLTQRNPILLPSLVLIPVSLALAITLYPFGQSSREIVTEPQTGSSPAHDGTGQDDRPGLSRDIGKAYSALQTESAGVDDSEALSVAKNHDTDPVDSEEYNAGVDTDPVAIPINPPEIVSEPVITSPVLVPNREVDLLQKRLLATRNLLASANENMATIQVLTLFSKNSPEESLSRYFDRLKRAGIDLRQVYVYRATKKQALVHGVLFGTYADRKQALQQIKSLPDILRENHPIPRTVGGIRQETGL